MSTGGGIATAVSVSSGRSPAVSTVSLQSSTAPPAESSARIRLLAGPRSTSLRNVSTESVACSVARLASAPEGQSTDTTTGAPPAASPMLRFCAAASPLGAAGGVACGQR
ncbi:unnamed protein product, partial [Prorocentrum cordatum]